MFTDQKDHIEWRIQKGDLFFVLTIATVICTKIPVFRYKHDNKN